MLPQIFLRQRCHAPLSRNDTSCWPGSVRVDPAFEYSLVVVWNNKTQRVVNDAIAFEAPTAIITVADYAALGPEQKHEIQKGLLLVWEACMWKAVYKRLPTGLEFQVTLEELVSGLGKLSGWLSPTQHVLSVRDIEAEQPGESAWIVSLSAHI